MTKEEKINNLSKWFVILLFALSLYFIANAHYVGSYILLLLSLLYWPLSITILMFIDDNKPKKVLEVVNILSLSYHWIMTLLALQCLYIHYTALI